MRRILVSGLGRVGYRTFKHLRELIKDAVFYVVESDKSRLEHVKELPGVETFQYEPGILGRLAERADIAVTALPSSVGYRAVLELVDKCIDIVDVSFFREDPYVLEKIVDDCRSRLVVDAGFAPGYSNVVAGYVYHVLGLDEEINIAVGGIPCENIPPIGYTVTWNPRDLLEEYIRPARYIENHELRTGNPLDHVFKVSIEDFGELEGFLSDGLRTMLRNIKARNMREITLRWPGHIDAIKVLYRLGFLDTSEINVANTRISPIDYTASLLEKKLSPRVPDVAIMHVKAIGKSGETYNELALLFGTPEDPAIPVFTALVHAYTVKIIHEEGVKPGIYPLEELYPYKINYEKYLASKGVVIKTSRHG
ncbi:MAG: saccharopine dehydrogenase C-terminal domain-containing protein [Desulfurococcaceae archaeon]